MIHADYAIARLRRDLTLSSVLQGTLLAGALLCIVVGAVVQAGGMAGVAALGVIGTLWVVLSYRSIRSSRLAAVSPSLIAQGNFEQAEAHIGEALRSFSFFRSVKLRTLHHLALLRHAQRRWEETAVLCRELLRQRLGNLSGLSRSARLIMADSLLQIGDLRAAHEALSGLYSQRLTLGEALELTVVQLDYQARIEAWGAMMEGVAKKTELAELMPGERAAKVQALLALAARRTGNVQWESWLKHRAELLADPADLVYARPALLELWQESKQRGNGG